MGLEWAPNGPEWGPNEPQGPTRVPNGAKRIQNGSRMGPKQNGTQMGPIWGPIFVWGPFGSHVGLILGARWGPLMQALDPCDPEEADRTPAFREGGRHSLPLSTDQMREVFSREVL